jgi:hypothetical protein
MDNSALLETLQISAAELNRYAEMENRLAYEVIIRTRFDRAMKEGLEMTADLDEAERYARFVLNKTLSSTPILQDFNLFAAWLNKVRMRMIDDRKKKKPAEDGFTAWDVHVNSTVFDFKDRF